MNIFRSEGHEIYSMRMDKVSLSLFDTKWLIEDDGVHMLAYGHKKIRHGLVREEAEYSEAQPIALCEQTALRPVRQIDNRFVWFSYGSFKMVYFRPNWVCSSFSPTFKFAGLIQISYINKWGEFFFFQTNRF